MCSTKQRLAAVLREQRSLRGWSLREAAERASLAPSTLSRWESGTCLPRVPELESLLTSLGAGERDIVRILSSLDAPRATRAVRVRNPDVLSDSPPNGGDVLRNLRHRAGLTISQVAEKLGVAVSTVSRWEASVAHPSSETGQALMNLLNASPAERRCYANSGVAKIKSERPPFDPAYYAKELETVENRIAGGRRNDCELRLLQLQSNLWWLLSEPGAPALLRRTHLLLGEFLVSDGRYGDAELHAEAALEASPEIYDECGVRAQIIIGRIQAYRGPVPRPHLGLLTMQRCLVQAKDEGGRTRVLLGLAELSIEGLRLVEAESYARRAEEAASRLGNIRLMNAASELLRRLRELTLQKC